MTSTYHELRIGVNHLLWQQNMLMRTMERQTKLVKGAPEVIQKKSCHKILKWEEKLMEVESEWFDAFAKLRTWSCRRWSRMSRGTKVHSESDWIKGLRLDSKAVRVLPTERRERERKALLRKESADTQEYEPKMEKDMDMHVDECGDELRLVPSAVDFVALRTPSFKCDDRYQEGVFQCSGIATEKVEANGELCTQDGADLGEATVFRAHASPQGA